MIKKLKMWFYSRMFNYHHHKYMKHDDASVLHNMKKKSYLISYQMLKYGDE